ITASAGLIILISLIPLLSAQYYSAEATSFYKQRNADKTLTYMQKAAFYDPFHAEYHIALSDLYRFTGQLDKAMDEMNEALLRSKFNPDIRIGLSNIALQRGDHQNAIKYSEEAIEMAPWQIFYYEFAGSTYKSAGLVELKNKRPQEADKYFLLAMNLPKRIQEKRNSLDSFKQKYSNSLGITPKIALTTGVSEFLVGNTKEASVNLKRALGDKSIKGEAYVWLSLLSEKQGDPKSAEKYLNEAKKISPQLENSYQELKHLLQ
ncbi:MAG: tetratricopeptide repeat protein, partial [Desulfocucumaceae bacterium]